MTYLKLHNEEHCDVNSSPYVQMIKSRMRWGIRLVVERIGAYRVVVEKWKEMESIFGRSRHGWEDNIKMDFLRNTIGG